MYVTVKEVRDNVPSVASMDDDPQILSLISIAEKRIEGLTGNVFELDTRTETLYIRENEFFIVLDHVLHSETEIKLNDTALTSSQYRLGYGAKNKSYCYVKLKDSLIVPDDSKLEITGSWGWVNTSSETPTLIKRACYIIIEKIARDIEEEGGIPDGIIEEWTDGHKYKLDKKSISMITGNKELDEILIIYRKPMRMGVAY